MLTPEQIVAAQRANLETLFGLTHKAFEGLERMVDLNVQATRATFNEMAHNTQAVLSAKDAQELLELQARLMEPLAAKVNAYSRQLFEIATETGEVWSKTAAEQSTEAQQQWFQAFDSVAQNAPAGTESLVGAVRQALQAATGAMGQVQKAVKQAHELAQTSAQTLTSAPGSTH